MEKKKLNNLVILTTITVLMCFFIVSLSDTHFLNFKDSFNKYLLSVFCQDLSQKLGDTAVTFSELCGTYILPIRNRQ